MSTTQTDFLDLAISIAESEPELFMSGDQLPQAESQHKLATVQIVATVQPHANSEHLQIASFVASSCSY